MSFDDDKEIVILKDVSSGKEALTFPAGKIQIQVVNHMEAPLEETRFKVLLELKEPGDIEGRHGLDLVMVIDISGSMNEGGKLDKLKIAAQFIVEKLSPVDRFSVVTFFDSSNRLFPLRQITEDSKAEIIQEIRLLKAKNSDKNIAEGLKMSLKVLNDRHFTDGRVGAIMLFSDGAENRGKATEVDVSKVPVHTFGFGASHDDQRVLSEIANKSNRGRFSNVQNENRLHVAFSKCLDELLTVVVKDLRLIVAQVNKESIIKNVVAGNYSTYRTKKSKFTISYGSLYGKEVRNVLVDLVLPNIVETGPRAEDLLLITCSYRWDFLQIYFSLVIFELVNLNINIVYEHACSTKYGKKRSNAGPIVITVNRTGLKEIRPEDVTEQKDEEKR
ncbi:Uncharacterized protein L484_010148 [Morus notabilis]|uniref:VWFA domain-containing protein n=1 Tax=Morus notabilis TaxID=981085 RepID=W9RY76_9ROSA|nr:Uncharacterized protein L484_010148 [Morus notabilis]